MNIEIALIKRELALDMDFETGGYWYEVFKTRVWDNF